MEYDLRPEVARNLLDIMRKLLADLVELGDPAVTELEADRAARFSAERVISALSDLAVAINTHLCAVTGTELAAGRAATFDAVVGLGVIDQQLAVGLQESVPLRDDIADTAGGIERERLAVAVPRYRAAFAAYAATVAAWVDARSPAGPTQRDAPGT